MGLTFSIKELVGGLLSARVCARRWVCVKFKGARSGLVLMALSVTQVPPLDVWSYPKAGTQLHTVSELTAEWAEAWRNRRQAHYQMAKQSRADEFRSRWSQDSSQRLPHAPHEAPAPVPGVMTPVFQVRKQEPAFASTSSTPARLARPPPPFPQGRGSRSWVACASPPGRATWAQPGAARGGT